MATAANSPAVILAGKLWRLICSAAASSSAFSSGSIRTPSVTLAAPLRPLFPAMEATITRLIRRFESEYEQISDIAFGNWA